jgi:hypothetical protein
MSLLLSHPSDNFHEPIINKEGSPHLVIGVPV